MVADDVGIRIWEGDLELYRQYHFGFVNGQREAITTPAGYKVMMAANTQLVEVLSIERSLGIARADIEVETYIIQEGTILRVLGPGGVNVPFKIPVRVREEQEKLASFEFV